MSISKVILDFFYIFVAFITVFHTFYTVVDLMIFLSYPHYINQDEIETETDGVFVTWRLLSNMFLITAFVFQHSFMTFPKVKQLFKDVNLSVLQRSIYVLCTSLSLKFLIDNWQPTNVILWEFNVSRSLIWWLFLSPHVMAWTVIYVGIICMDVNELLGLKQVYYSIKNLPDPLQFKSAELRQLYSHVRHPSFIGFLILLWITPVMSLDRLLLATILSSYMYLAWNTNDVDLRYQETQYVTKFHELNHVR